MKLQEPHALSVVGLYSYMKQGSLVSRNSVWPAHGKGSQRF